MTKNATIDQSVETIKVHQNDLPLCCPGKQTDAAEIHPRVFLPIEKTGLAVCPYCGASYELAD
ncbi:zinc-finger domain-containing protein [Candidatus Vondammii sp. HM_W22]|uniref:zinc-finger domain-containing protein n=1 Tax=Candidatus Vondammii sp. HM_W22 TaxID=2687299 RepID=UPI001F12FA16|nr:zinc-finger domain-containing protein [Candidatus Vondammii sp. HM_W22]